MPPNPRLELTWIGKENRPRLEPRILLEDPSKSCHAKHRTGKKDIFDNRLIFGDNLLVLKALEQEFTGKVKCVYIDPPYNTGSAFEHYDDGIEHSIWLGLMRDRIELLHKLLVDDGSIWISIDDAEVAYLKIMTDEIFGRNNFVAQLPTIMNLKGNQDEFAFAGTHEYTLVYAKNRELLHLNQFTIDEEEVIDKWEIDDIGQYKQGANLKATGINAPKEKRPNLFFPIYIANDNKIYFEPKAGTTEVLPITDGKEMSWRWSKQKMLVSMYDIIIKRSKDGISLYKKQRPELGELPSKKPKTLFYKPEYSSGNGTNQIKALFGAKVFDYPKPEHLIADFITLASNPGDLVLDSFAGSGTTGAVAHKMGRRWIMVELGEHCHTHIIPRLKKVIHGEDPGGVTEAAGWKGGGGFRYYRLAPSLLQKDKWDNWIINKEYNAEMLAEAVCKLEGFTYEPSESVYWIHGKSTENDFIYVTTAHLTHEQLTLLSEEVGSRRTLLVMCTAFRSRSGGFPNLTIKKIPNTVLAKCEWGHDDYSLQIENLPMAKKPEKKQRELFEEESTNYTN
jgi:adenine-specific DNA-methyltransferase